MKASGLVGDRGRLLVCFDFEDSYGIPHKECAVAPQAGQRGRYGFEKAEARRPFKGVRPWPHGIDSVV